MTIDPIIHAEKLQKSYGDFIAVKGIDFDIYPGEIFGFLGPNGAGKTSTMKMIYGSAPITSGTLNVQGMSFPRDMRRIKSILGVVTQENNLDNEITVEQNMIIHALHHRMHRRQAREKSRELLEFVHLYERRNDSVRELSGGMKRRLMIARGLINSPGILVLDEPTTGLDPQSRQILWSKMRQLRKTGITQLLTTHYMDEAEQLCDRLVIIDQGMIIDRGTPAELIEKHTGREAVELAADTPGIARILDTVKLSVRYSETTEDRVLLYTDDSSALLQLFHEHFPQLRPQIIRRAGLEDVFLKLTGRHLRE